MQQGQDPFAMMEQMFGGGPGSRARQGGMQQMNSMFPQNPGS